MKRSVFLVIASLVALIFGIGLLVRPIHMMHMFNVGMEPSSLFMARMAGISMISLGLTLWIGRNAADSAAMSGILVAGLFQNLAMAVLAVHMINKGWMNSMGWGAVVLHLLLALGFLTYLVKKKPA